eukprot:10458790-Lingulodinium_polyedra.AAC.1
MLRDANTLRLRGHPRSRGRCRRLGRLPSRLVPCRLPQHALGFRPWPPASTASPWCGAWWRFAAAQGASALLPPRPACGPGPSSS